MNLIKDNNDNNRIVYFDYLRIIATIAVIIIHVVAQNYYFIDVRSFEWNVLNIYHSITLWAVPIFVMISGSLFLRRDLSVKKIYSKNILKIVTVFIFWSVFYSISHILLTGNGIRTYIFNLFGGYYHMWFLFMILGLYMIVPFLKKIIESNQLIKYFLILSLIFTFVLPQFISLISLVSKDASLLFNNMMENFSFYFTLGYVGYFVCGYYLGEISINKKWRKIIYILGIIGFIVTIIMTAVISYLNQESSTLFYDYLTINVMFQSVFIFIFAKQHLNVASKNEKIREIVSKLSKYSLGIYLIHPFIITIFYKFLGLHCLSFNPLISVPVIAIIVFIMSAVISAIINKIPILNKYVV